MKNLLCDQCKIHRFCIKNDNGDRLVVTVNSNHEIISVDPEISIEEYDTTTLFCLGCSWKGSAKSLSKTS